MNSLKMQKSPLLFSNVCLRYIHKKTLNTLRCIIINIAIDVLFKNTNKWLVSLVTFPGEESCVYFKENSQILQDLKRHNWNYFNFQFVTGNEVKVSLYPEFREAKICQKHLTIADMINFNDGNFRGRTFSLIQRTGIARPHLQNSQKK